MFRNYKLSNFNGFFSSGTQNVTIRKFFITLQDDSLAIGKVTGDMDPGYGSTSKMLAESAICLAKDDIPDVGGMLTPSVAMGDALLQRLQDNAGLTFSFSK